MNLILKKIKGMRETRLPAPDPNNPVIKAYIEAVQKGDRALYVRPTDDNKWTITVGMEELLNTFETRKEAVAEATRISTERGVNLFLWNKAGDIVKSIYNE